MPEPHVLRDWLCQRYPQAKITTLRRMLQQGRVVVNGQVARRLDQPIGAGDVVSVSAAPKERLPARRPSSVHPLRLVFEDADLLVVEKPAGLLSSTVRHERRPTALAILRHYLAEADPAARLGLIHRLDRDASGLLVFSKNESAFRSLKEQFFHHRVLRVYLAISRRSPQPPRGRIENRLIERADGTVRVADPDRSRDRGELAITDYATAGQEQGRAAVLLMLHTGRKHQIRAHLLGRCGGVVNDRLYRPASGEERGASSEAGRLMLAALMLGFAHPRSGRWMQFDLPVPRDFPLAAGERVAQLAQEAGMRLAVPEKVEGEEK